MKEPMSWWMSLKKSINSTEFEIGIGIGTEIRIDIGIGKLIDYLFLLFIYYISVLPVGVTCLTSVHQDESFMVSQ
jgi:hypothetical protein